MMLAAALLLAAPVDPTLTQFETALAAQPSATLALEGWCGQRNYAQPAKVVAQRFSPRPEAPVPTAARAALDVPPSDPVAVRHVDLICGSAHLSQAHNWYVPARLTPAMNAALATTDTPFGKVVAPLHFTRETLETIRGPAPDCPPDTVLAHRARLRLPDGRPLALLLECYRHAVLAPPHRAPPAGLAPLAPTP
jgi:hypothetical protein